MLAALQSRHALTSSLSCLQSLKLSQVQRVESLSGIHLWLLQQNLSLWKLNQLWLVGKLKTRNGTNWLVHGSANTMPGLKDRCRGMVHVEVAHVCHLLLLDGRLVGILLTPVSIKISGSRSAMTRAAAALKIGLISLITDTAVPRWKLETAATSAHRISTTVTDSHTLASTMRCCLLSITRF